MRHGPGQCGGNVAKTSGLYQVGNLRGDEQDSLLVGILTGYRCQRLGGRRFDRFGIEDTDGARFPDLLMSTFSLDI
ncbi:hypothetical protein D3C81_2222380 [compost metagenome]